MPDSEVPHSQNLKIIRDEAARLTPDMVQTRASAQRLVLFSIGVLGATIPIYTQVSSPEVKKTIICIVVLLSANFYGRAHILYSQIILKGAFLRALDVMSNRLVGIEIFNDPENTRFYLPRKYNKFNMLIAPVLQGLVILFVMGSFGVNWYLNKKCSDILGFGFSFLIGGVVLFLLWPVFTGVFYTRGRFQDAVTEYLKRAGQERDTFEFIEKN